MKATQKASEMKSIVILSFLLISFFPLSSLEVSAFETDWDVSIFASDAVHQQYPDIHGNLLVWSEDSGADRDIVLFDLTLDSDGDGIPNWQDPDRPVLLEDPARYVISNASEDQIRPAIWEDQLVWEDYRTGISSEIYFYDLSMDSDGDGIPNYRESAATGGRPYPDPAEIAITNTSAPSQTPDVYDSKVIWADKREVFSDIFLYDLMEKREIQLNGNELNFCGFKPKQSKQWAPSIHHGWVAWTDNRNTGTSCKVDDLDMFGYDLFEDSDSDGIPNWKEAVREIPDMAEMQLTTSNSSEELGTIWNGQLVFSREGTIVLRTIDTGTEYILATPPGGDLVRDRIAFQSTKVVWSWGSGSSKDVYVYDLNTDSDGDGVPNYMENISTNDVALFALSSGPERQELPAVHNNVIVWQDLSTIAHFDIYIAIDGSNSPPQWFEVDPNDDIRLPRGTIHPFLALALDPDDASITYTWSIDGQIYPNVNGDTFGVSTLDRAIGEMELAVLASDQEYMIEWSWLVQIVERSVGPQIHEYAPNGTILIKEGSSGFFWINATSGAHRTDNLVFKWSLDGVVQPAAVNQTFHMFVKPDEKAEYNLVSAILAVNVSDENGSAILQWTIWMQYVEDRDEDGFSDILEVELGSDPGDSSSTPADLDGDGIPDALDDDADGDGRLDGKNEKGAGEPDIFSPQAYAILLFGLITMMALYLATSKNGKITQ